MEEKSNIQKEGIQNNSQKGFKQKVKKIPVHNWAITTYILGILVIILLIQSFSGGVTGRAISGNEAGEKLSSVLGLYYQDDFKYTSFKDLGSVYEITIDYDGETLPPMYVTKDGKYLANELPSVEELKTQQQTTSPPQTQQQVASSYSQEDLVQIETFTQCLAQKDFIVYGANWCGYTKQVVTLFGGFDVIDPVYVECTEDQELCAQEGIQGYPTIRVGGQAYQGQRTFEGFAQATGCTAPKINGFVTTSSTDVQCG